MLTAIMTNRTSLSLGMRRVGIEAAKAVAARSLPILTTLQNRLFSGPSPEGNQHIVVALGGNALLKRKEPMTMENQRNNIRKGMESLKNILQNNTITMVHGNGPQVGLLVLESAAYEKETGLEQMRLDVLDAETEGMIGYLLEQEMQPFLPPDRGLATILSQIEVDKNDPAFQNPTKFIGPVLTKEEADKMTLPVKPDGEHFRRVVPSPIPVKMLDNQLKAVKSLTRDGTIVICAGGGGIPCIYDDETNRYVGVEAVIDKDKASCMMGLSLDADGLLILTDVPAVALDFNADHPQWIKAISPGMLKTFRDHFPDGSMGPKVDSVIDFVENSYGKGWAAIGWLNEAEQIMSGEAGTLIQERDGEDFIEFYEDVNDETKTA